MHSCFRPFQLLLLWWLLAANAIAQVPQLLHYQGRVRVNGADYSGTGQFKFALVNGAGSTTFWSNDGSSAGGSQPSAAVSLTVQGGLYSVLLGDATVPNMGTLPAGVFANPEVRLRVWFSDGTNGWQQLSPDQRVAAVGYALMAEEVRDGTVTAAKLAEGAVTTAKLAPGAVNSAALAPGAVTENLAAAGQGTVPAGATLMSTAPNAPALLAAGYVASGSINAGDNWTAISGGTVRDRAASVWTGTEMLIWGDGNEGWRYNPTTNVWTAMSTVGQPANREAPLAVWTGTEMIVWGGISGTDYPATGGRYNPTTDSWTAVTTTNAPPGRVVGTAVWTGSEMLIWGGNNTVILGTGARYNPTQGGPGGTWQEITTTGAPSFRYNHTAVWSGNSMLIYGGRTGTAALNDGGRFIPASGTWTAMPPGPSARYFHTAVWNGTGMMVWGGTDGSGVPFATGSIFNPASNGWTSIPADGAPAARLQHEAVWAGSEMIVWGGSTTAVNPLAYTSTGARFNPLTNRWTALAGGEPPAGRVRPNLQWTGSEMIVWGGTNGTGFNTGGKLRTGQTLYLYQRP